MEFLGTTTPADLLASVTTGVQTTGADIWPLIVLAGIPIAFVVGGFIVSFVRRAIGGRK